MVKRPFRHRSAPRRLLDLALAVTLLAALAFVAARWPDFAGSQVTLSGPARVSDGDSISIEGRRIRLAGIDAPEIDQSCIRASVSYACGRKARAALVAMIGGSTVVCESGRLDRYGRLLARCTANGIDLNQGMVEAGWAVSYGGYAAVERDARRAGRGIWAGDFEFPQEWRRIHGGLAESPHDWIAVAIDWMRSVFSGMVGGESIEVEEVR